MLVNMEIFTNPSKHTEMVLYTVSNAQKPKRNVSLPIPATPVTLFKITVMAEKKALRVLVEEEPYMRQNPVFIAVLTPLKIFRV